MTITIDRDDAADVWVDRSGDGREPGVQGFHVYLPGVKIAFEDERDAEQVARLVLDRLGIDVPKQLIKGDE